MTVIFNDVESGEQIACLQASLANGWSTRQDGVLWGTSMFALLAVAVAWLHTAWNYSRLDPLTLTRGDAAAVGPTEAELAAGGLVTGSSSPAQWRAVDVVYLFQTIASCGLLTIDYPSVFSAFVLNFRWSLGIFTTPAVQRAIVSARNKTGGKMSRCVRDGRPSAPQGFPSSHSLTTAFVSSRARPLARPTRRSPSSTRRRPTTPRLAARARARARHRSLRRTFSRRTTRCRTCCRRRCRRRPPTAWPSARPSTRRRRRQPRPRS